MEIKEIIISKQLLQEIIISKQLVLPINHRIQIIATTNQKEVKRVSSQPNQKSQSHSN